jgi:hypothetical protein
MTIRPRVAFLAGPADHYALIHLRPGSSKVTVCGQIPALTMEPLPLGKSAWPDGPRCESCFQALPSTSPSRPHLA